MIDKDFLNDFLKEHRDRIEDNGYFDYWNFKTASLLLLGVKANMISYTTRPGESTMYVFDIDGERFVLREWVKGDYGYAFV